MNQYRYKAVPRFWRSYARLTPSQQAQTKAIWVVFRRNPFDPRLGTHKTHRLSAAAGRTVWSVTIAEDLPAVFIIHRNTVTTLDIGTHDIYQP